MSVGRSRLTMPEGAQRRGLPAVARRPVPGERVAPTGVRLSADVLDSLAADCPAFVRIEGMHGHSAVAVAELSTTAGEPAERAVRLGRLLWPQLEAKPGDPLWIEPAAIPGARSVRVIPPTALSPRLEERLASALRGLEAVVWDGAKILVHAVGPREGLVVRIRGAEPGPAVLTGSTEITFESADAGSVETDDSLAQVGGLGDVIERLERMLIEPLVAPDAFWELGIAPPRGVLLHGPPGTGKTLLGRVLASQLREKGVHVVARAATELVGSYSGETEANLRALFSDAAHHAPAAIILDEVDVLATDRTDLASQSDVRATSQFLALLDGLETIAGVIVLATTNRIDVIDGAFRRPGRFDAELHIAPPSSDARRDILRVHTRDMPMTTAVEERVEQLSGAATSGFTGADLMSLAREIGLAAFRRLEDERARATIEGALPVAGINVADIDAALERVDPSLLRGLPMGEPDLSWGEIAVLDEVKAQLEAAADHVIAGIPQEGLLLVGPSGAGKTTVARALAQEFNLPFIDLDPGALFTQWLGKSEAAVNSLFATARSATPSLLAIEHVDAIAPRRSTSGRERADDRVHAALLSALDETLSEGGVLVVGLTDRADEVEPSVVRRGRLGRRIDIPAPPATRRREIIERALAPQGKLQDPAEIEALVTHCEGWVAAEIDAWARDGCPREAAAADAAGWIGSTP